MKIFITRPGKCFILLAAIGSLQCFLYYWSYFKPYLLSSVSEVETLAITNIKWHHNYLITGGAGFIGSHLANRLLREWSEELPYRVIIVDNFDNYYSPLLKQRNIDRLLKHYSPRVADGSFIVIRGSINDRHLMANVFQVFRITHVVHLAALPGVRLPISHVPRYTETNYDGTQALLEQAIAHNISVFVFTSSSSVYGRTRQIPFIETDPCDKPLSPYAASKRAAEILCHVYHNLHGLNVAILRLFNVYGPNGRPDMMPAHLFHASVDSRKVTTIFNNGSMRRDWTYIDDVVSGIVQALAKPVGYEIFNIGHGHPTKLSLMIRYIQQLTNSTKILRNVRFENASAAEPFITYANISKARQMLQYRPLVSLMSGLNRTWLWFKNEKDAPWYT